jgi:hypothetical protein
VRGREPADGGSLSPIRPLHIAAGGMHDGIAVRMEAKGCPEEELWTAQHPAPERRSWSLVKKHDCGVLESTAAKPLIPLQYYIEHID